MKHRGVGGACLSVNIAKFTATRDLLGQIPGCYAPFSWLTVRTASSRVRTGRKSCHCRLACPSRARRERKTLLVGRNLRLKPFNTTACGCRMLCIASTFTRDDTQVPTVSSCCFHDWANGWVFWRPQSVEYCSVFTTSATDDTPGVR